MYNYYDEPEYWGIWPLRARIVSASLGGDGVSLKGSRKHRDVTYKASSGGRQTFFWSRRRGVEDRGW